MYNDFQKTLKISPQMSPTAWILSIDLQKNIKKY